MDDGKVIPSQEDDPLPFIALMDSLAYHFLGSVFSSLAYVSPPVFPLL